MIPSNLQLPPAFETKWMRPGDRAGLGQLVLLDPKQQRPIGLAPVRRPSLTAVAVLLEQTFSIQLVPTTSGESSLLVSVDKSNHK